MSVRLMNPQKSCQKILETDVSVVEDGGLVGHPITFQGRTRPSFFVFWMSPYIVYAVSLSFSESVGLFTSTFNAYTNNYHIKYLVIDVTIQFEIYFYKNINKLHCFVCLFVSLVTLV